MMSLYRRNEKRGTNRSLVATVLVAVLLLVDLLTGGAVRGFVRTAALPVWQAGSQVVAAASGSGFFSSRRTLQEENERLREELALLRAENAETRIMQENIEVLRKLVRVAERVPGLTAAIVSTGDSPYGTFTIQAGESDGLTVGSLVYAGSDSEDSVVIGRVSEVGARHSLVTEFFAPGASLDVSAKGVLFQLEGRGGGNARAEVPSTAPLAEGDIVFSAEAGGEAIGFVGAIRGEAGDALKTLFIRTPVSVSDLRFVYIGL